MVLTPLAPPTPLSFRRFCIYLLRCGDRFAILDRQSQRVFGDVLHRAEKSHGVEIVEEAEVRDAEDLALHLPLAVGGDECKLRLQRLDDVAGVHAFRHGNGSSG